MSERDKEGLHKQEGEKQGGRMCTIDQLKFVLHDNKNTNGLDNQMKKEWKSPINLRITK